MKTCDELVIQDGNLADWKGILHNVHNLVQFFSFENHNLFLFNKFVLAQGDSPGFLIRHFGFKNKVTFGTKYLFLRIGIHNARLNQGSL